MSGMAKLIEAAAASNPDGIVVSLPDPDALGGAIRAAADAGIPVITMNSGLEIQLKLVHWCTLVSQNFAEQKLESVQSEGVTNGLCLNQEAWNTALVDRCEGYFAGLGGSLNMIDVSNDVQQIETRTAAALSADPSIDGILAAGPHVCAAANKAIKDVGADVHLACFDMSDDVTAMLRSGDASFTTISNSVCKATCQSSFCIFTIQMLVCCQVLTFHGPGFVDASNIDNVASQAGINR